MDTGMNERMNTKIDTMSMYYANLLSQATQYSIDCKMFGAVCTVSEIENAVALVHSPEGCAYFPRFLPTDALRMKLLGRKEPPRVYSTELNETDVVYGGEETLEKAILELDRTVKPELIAVVNSCVPAIIGDDIENVVSHVADRVDAAVVTTPSAGFEHDDRGDSIDELTMDTINAWKKDGEITFGIERCGRLDAMYSLIEQLTEDADTIENSINLDTFGRFHYFEDLKGELDEITALLGRMGVTVNVIFPGCSVSDIRRMSAAELNFMRRSEKSAQFMQEKYGIDYLFDPLCAKYSGLEGIEQFYRDIASKFNLDGECEDMLKKEKDAMNYELEGIRRIFTDKTFSLVVVPMTVSIEYLKILEFIGVTVTKLFINTEWLERFGTKKEHTAELADELAKRANELGISEVAINLDASDEVNAAKGVDLAIISTLTDNNERAMFYEHNGIPAINPDLYGYSAYRISHSMIITLARALAGKINGRQSDRRLLFYDYPIDGWRFPCLKETLHCRTCWEETMSDVWRQE